MISRINKGIGMISNTSSLYFQSNCDQRSKILVLLNKNSPHMTDFKYKWKEADDLRNLDLSKLRAEELEGLRQIFNDGRDSKSAGWDKILLWGREKPKEFLFDDDFGEKLNSVEVNPQENEKWGLPGLILES
jgi:hypothetical protein